MSNEPISRKPARVESFDQQLEQSRICHEQFEKATPQSIRFREADEAREASVRIGHSRQLRQ